ncbi:amidase [Rhodovibrio salinarum]|uniref:Amidase n=1 Tax=Rhodovibrio salinarum TaxID=1087 RepID=A0A934QFD9_9PROT|nr:amidase [Rhodovibrio salinarum]MBK1695899.1 amidase [Rhodovibrio salinarum]
MPEAATDLAAAMRALAEQHLSASDLAEQAIAAHDPALNAYAAWTPETTRAQAAAADAARQAGATTGPLMGVPVSLKDIYAAAGWRTYAGSPKALPAEPWERDGPLVAKLRRQLATITGKTNTVEFAFSGLGTNPHWGTPRNPWNRARVAGGSSSGAAVSVREGSALLALGTDTAGSIRVPAAMNGLAGLKMGAGQWPTEGIVPLSHLLDTPGLIARTAQDLAIGYGALNGDAPGAAPMARPDLTGVRLCVPAQVVWDDTAPGIAEAVESALRELEAAGAKLLRRDVPEVLAAVEVFRTTNLAGPDLYRLLSTELTGWLDTVDPSIRQRLDKATDVPAWQWLAARARVAELSRAAAERLRDCDALVAPTVALTPPEIDAVQAPDAFARANGFALRNTAVGNYLTMAGVTLPAGLDAAGMPVGLQLLGQPGGEAGLLALAQTVERVLGTSDQRLGTPPAA